MADHMLVSNTPSGVRMWSPEGLKVWEATFAGHSHHERMRSLIVAYARDRGGLTLEFWRLFMGPFFGEPQQMKAEAIANRLGVPVTELSTLADETWTWVNPRLHEKQ